MRKKSIGISLLGGMFAVLVSATPAFAATTAIYPDNMQGWGFAQETATGSGELVSGPDAPPLGKGSAKLIVDSTGGVVLGKAGYNGLRLDEIETLTYSTYRSSGGPALAIAPQFNIDLNVTDNDNTFQGRLVYEPYHTQAVTTGEWQTWDTLDDTAGTGTGNWFFSRAATSTLAGGCTMADPCTMTEVIEKVPDAGVSEAFGAVYLKAGGGWAGGFTGNVDALTINEDTYNFEGPRAKSPTNKDQCKNNGWQDGFQTQYKNQGDCVSSVASQGKSRGNPNPVNQVVDFFRSLF